MSLIARIKAIQGHLEHLCQIQIDRRIDELLAGPRYQNPRKLNRYEHKVFSQTGEDGILAEILNRAGCSNRIFAECSPGSGAENNTVYLLNLGWTGCWIESEPKHVKAIQRAFASELSSKKLAVQEEIATAENIETLFAQASLPAEFDLLSIDIDRNDYWLWRGIEHYRPRVVVIEYNAIFPPGCDWVVAYDPKAFWDGTTNRGASLTALERLGAQKGYKLVGCTLAGTNAFFVREDLAGEQFLEPFTAVNHYEPARYYLASRRAGDRRAFQCGATTQGSP